ncbi:MAG: hypothetical protein COV48_01700 [Elusimicrobia bacterium CG11_big_fil_rev_8_21_14_0_20_64_6]|nr:MAG: hypothetical protein COV48_01700 [Elusimicrobia bacterium CG11_big_fil_rev_8_21_14_0_20_64_6]
MNSRRTRVLLVLLLCAAARPAVAQIDPERRQLLQLGLNQAIDGRGPLAAYAYYYLNSPHFFAPKRTLRLVVAPGYADSELGFEKALGENTDFGVGLAGGAMADSHTEIRRDRYVKGESFRGDGFRAALGLYHDFPAYGPVPLAGIVRVEGHYAKFTRDKTADPGFAIPEAQSEINMRAGFRLGGKEPVLHPNLAMEISGWYEGRYRLAPMAYGFAGDRRAESDVQLLWARALLIYNKPESDRRFIALASGGTSLRADRFSAYRLGGDLPMAAEFPLSLPGYYYDEISARRYALLGGSYVVPLCRDKRTWTASLTASTALVEYAPGLDQRGKTHTGVGAGVAYLSHSKAWQVLTAYGYGVNAARGHGNGGHTVGLLVQFDFERVQVPFFHPSDPNSGLHHLLRGQEPLSSRLKFPAKLLPRR